MNTSLKHLLKGIIVGIGGVVPGLSGSVLLIIFGLYRKTLEALGNFFSDIRKNLSFLLPLVAGMFIGILLFSNIIDYLLHQYEMPTRFCFLGLILGTLPMVWNEVKKEGIRKYHYVIVFLSAVFGLLFFAMNPDSFRQVTDPSLIQCIILGVAVAATAIIPGVDPAVFLSTLGFYEMYVRALADFEIHILIPMVLGLAAGAIALSFGMTWLFRRYYTVTFSVIFGVFLSMIPNMLNEKCVLARDFLSVASILLMCIGFTISFYLGKLGQKTDNHNEMNGK